ncbi:MAG: hypothetical protein ACRC17_05270 [Culicoidibacterales bacterium]
MLEQVTNLLLKVFQSDNSTIKTILAFILAIGILKFFPEKSVLNLFGEWDIWVSYLAIGGAIFLMISVIELCWNKYKANKLEYLKQINLERKQQEAEEKKRFHTWFDCLTTNDKYIFESFVINDNKILITNKNERSTCLYSQVLCDLEYDGKLNATEFVGKIYAVDDDKYWFHPEIEKFKSSKQGDDSTYHFATNVIYNLYQYKLSDDYFDCIKSIYETDGGFGNF